MKHRASRINVPTASNTWYRPVNAHEHFKQMWSFDALGKSREERFWEVRL